jgi:hypothetical protein
MYLLLPTALLSLLSLVQAGHTPLRYQAEFCSIEEQSLFPSFGDHQPEGEHQHLRSCSRHHHEAANPRTSSFAPWTAKRQCLEDQENYEEYCVYSKSDFANGRGISFFTTRSIAKRVESLPAFTQQGIYNNVNKFDNPPWEIRRISGRGKGLFATRTFHRGDEIIAATPIGVYHHDAVIPDAPIGYQYLRKAFDQLPNATQEIMLRTAANNPGDPIMERINTNAFLGEFEGAPHYLFYPETAVRRTILRHVISS